MAGLPATANCPLPPLGAAAPVAAPALSSTTATGLSGAQTLANITFTGVGAKATSSSIDLAVTTLTDATGAPLAATTSAGRIHIN